ncbi:WD40 repeat domain-containing serine/threonine protein kinase [Paludisphaera mucosa]|uniref:Protein kinase n=1 Tax=Paludisphaera mucosa TaxID=3030827 RepID=A0ABT6FBV7_9BACT|nr:protein kinase [Paludisphaera mucosa]MDG3005030.1 protein kinase [Paludisphaera mucosa]
MKHRDLRSDAHRTTAYFAESPSTHDANSRPNSAAESTPTGLDPDLRAALRWAGFEVLGELGRGATGIVYLARNVSLNRPCAIKTFLAGGGDATASARLRAEAESVARLRHPHVVQIYSVGEAAGRPFLELEHLPGGNLADARDGAPWPGRAAAALIETVARAVAEIHRLGIIHRDLKPANILLTTDGEPKVGDFGLAKSLASGPFLTEHGRFVGTPAYVAPEQARAGGEAVGATADVYSLGAILYELLAGRPPFLAATVLQTLELARRQEPVPPRRMQPDVPRDLETICLKCLHKDPWRRYPGAEALADDLHRFLAGLPILARPTGPVERACKWTRRRPAVAALSAALLATAALGLVSVAWQWRRAEGRAVAESAARREAARGQAQLAMDHGRALCEQGEIGRGLLWLTRSLELAADARDRSLDRAARINLADWSARIGPLPTRLQVPAPALGLAFGRDGRSLVARGGDGTTRCWDAEGRCGPERPSSLAGPDSDATVAVSPDGRLRVVAEGLVVRRETAAGEAVGPDLTLGSPARRVAFIGDGRRVLAATEDGRVLAWEPASARVSDLAPEDSAVTCLAVSSDGERFATGSEGGTVRLWDSTTLLHQGPAFKLAEAVTSLAFRPDGLALAVGLDDGAIRIWEVPRSGPATPPLRASGPVRTVAFSRDGTQLLAVGDRGLAWWDLDLAGGGGRPRLVGRACKRKAAGGGRQGATGVATISPDGRLIAMVAARPPGEGDAARIVLLDAETGAVLRESPGAPQPTSGLAFSPDSRRLLAWGPRPGTASIREVDATATPRPIFRTLGVAVHQAAFSPDGRAVLLGCRDGKARLWDVARDVEIPAEAQPYHAYPITAVAFDPWTSRIATGCHAGTVRLWDRASGAMLCDVRGNAGEVAAVAFSPDGRTLLTASHDATARFWDVDSGRQLGPPLHHADAVLCVAFHPDGRSVATGTRDGRAWLWKAPPAPMPGDLDRISRDVEARTGLTFVEPRHAPAAP